MRRPKTVYKICTFALFCASLSACGGGSDASLAEAEPEKHEEGQGGAGGSGSMGGQHSGSSDEAMQESRNCPHVTSGYATEVLAFEFGEGQDFGRDEFPEQVLGGPEGGGLAQGSLHVTSLGDGGWVALGFSPRTIVDGEGPDFIVFENPFYAGGDPTAPVAELGRVAVSVDGDEWHTFPCEPGDSPPYLGCAGFTPVKADVTDAQSVSPFDAESAGGEAYDLADLGLSEVMFVRITDIAGDDAVFDLDAVAIVNGRCE